MSSSQRTTPPGPRGFSEILDVIRQRKRDPFRLYLNLTHRYGDLVYFKVGGIGYCLVNDPEAIQRVLQSQARNYPKGPGYERLRALLGYGLLTNEGEDWRRQRRLAAPAFLRERIVDFARQVAPIADRFADSWNGQEVLDVAPEMNRVAMQVVGETLLGSDPASRASEITEALLAALRFSDARGMTWLRLIDVLTFSKDRNLAFKIEQRLPTRANRGFQSALRLLDELMAQVIERRRQELAQGTPPRRDFLGLFMAAQDEVDGTGMSDRQLRDEVMSIFLAGHETTATALTWTLHLLSQHPEVARKLEGEIDRELGDRAPQFEDLARLRYAHHVFEESIRVYPPFWRFTRQAIEEDEIQGYRIPAGTVMIVSPYLTHRNPKFWAEPELFHPERFESDRTPSGEARHRFAYIPFGGGARVCIGSNFAVMEALMILTRLCQRYRFEPVPEHSLQFEAAITLRPATGLPLRLIPRVGASNASDGRSP